MVLTWYGVKARFNGIKGRTYFSFLSPGTFMNTERYVEDIMLDNFRGIDRAGAN